MKKIRNVTLTNLSEDQFKWLKETAEKKAMTISGLVKYWCQRGIESDGVQK